MHQILIYSDSLSWGIIPNTRNRLPFESRWTGVFENALLKKGKKVRVIENCLNGRRTVWSDPFKNGRDGSLGLSEVVEMHSPLSLVILMLGTNDFQCTHQNSAWLSAQGMAKLVRIVQQAPIEPCFMTPEILIIAPPAIQEPKGAISHKFKGAQKRYVGLATELKKVAKELSVKYFDANSIIKSSKIDGIHLDKPQHKTLGKAIAKMILDKGIL